MSQPRIGKFPGTTLNWSNGVHFNGFALFALIPPTDGTVSYPEGDFGLIDPTETLPQFAQVPISDGLFNSALGLFYNADISPPNTTYNLSYYDTTGRLIAGPSASFSVTVDPISTLPTLTLPVPSAGGTIPVPN